VHHECILRLHDLVVAVVGIRKHGRPGGENARQLILKTCILRARGVLHRVDTRRLASAAAGVRRECGRQQVSDDGGAESLDGAEPNSRKNVL